MSQYTFYSCGPVRRETLLLGAWADTPFGRQFHMHEHLVGWVQDSETEWGLFWDGTLLQKGALFSDFYGPLTSGEAACEEAAEKAAVLKLGPADRLEVRATCRIQEMPCRPGLGEPCGRRLEYIRLEGFFTGTPELLLRVEGFDWKKWREGEWEPGSARLENRLLADGVVWSSKLSSAENAAAVEAFLAPFRDRVGVGP